MFLFLSTPAPTPPPPSYKNNTFQAVCFLSSLCNVWGGWGRSLNLMRSVLQGAVSQFFFSSGYIPSKEHGEYKTLGPPC